MHREAAVQVRQRGLTSTALEMSTMQSKGFDLMSTQEANKLGKRRRAKEVPGDLCPVSNRRTHLILVKVS